MRKRKSWRRSQRAEHGRESNTTKDSWTSLLVLVASQDPLTGTLVDQKNQREHNRSGTTASCTSKLSDVVHAIVRYTYQLLKRFVSIFRCYFHESTRRYLLYIRWACKDFKKKSRNFLFQQLRIRIVAFSKLFEGKDDEAYFGNEFKETFQIWNSELNQA